MTDLGARLERAYSGAVFDVLRDLGRPNCLLPPAIRGLDPGMRCAGPVFTIRGRPDSSLSPERSLELWVELLALVPPGHVAVCQPQDMSRALMGELSAETLKFRGVKGYIVDGGCRDCAFIERLGFPTFARFATPRDIVAAWRPEAYEEPIAIGGVTIRMGDHAIADRDGVAIIPADLAEQTVAEVERVMSTENLVRKAILAGVDPREALKRYGKF